MIQAVGICYLTAMSECMVAGEFGILSLTIKDYFGLSEVHQQAWLAVCLVGTILGGAMAGSLVYRFGCMSMMKWSLVASVLADVGRSQAPRFGVFLSGALVGTFTAAINMCALTQYLSEVTSKASRGRVCAFIAFVGESAGMLKSWLFYALVDSSPDYWRRALLICTLPAAVTLLLLLYLRPPESPRHVQRTESAEEAAKTLAELLGTNTRDAEVQEALAKWREEAAHQVGDKSHALSEKILAQYQEVVSTERGRASLLVVFAQGVCGMIVLSSFMGFILEGAGMTRKQSQGWFAVASAVRLATACASSVLLVEQVGRRPLLLMSAGSMSAIFAALVAMHETLHAPTLATVLIVGQVLYMVGFGAVSNAYAPEILPNALRSAGLSLGKVVVSIGVFISGNGGMALLSSSRTAAFLFFVWVNAGNFVGIFYLCPETLGQPLEKEWEKSKLSQKTVLDMTSTPIGAEL